MKNYKEIFLKFLDECLENTEDLTIYQIDGIDLTKRILTKRFDIEINQYNGNEEKACDEFIARKNLGILNYYVEELYFIDKDIITEEHYAIRKQMRYTLNLLWNLLNESIK